MILKFTFDYIKLAFQTKNRHASVRDFGLHQFDFYQNIIGKRSFSPD